MTLKNPLLFLSLAGLAAAETFPVTIRVDLERPGAELKPIDALRAVVRAGMAGLE